MSRALPSEASEHESTQGHSESMRRVVIIGGDFVPSSLPPATRIRFLATHLPEFEWEAIVLTTDSQYYDWTIDNENERLLPGSVEVIRTPAFRSSWTRKIGIGDIGMRSLWHHWTALKQLCSQKQIDLVFIPVPPYMSMTLGRMAHKKFGIPYVIDYIDPWVTEYYWNVPRQQRPPKWPLAYAMSRIFEPYALKKVSHITSVSRGTIDGVVSRYDHLSDDDATEIPYGGEADDFEYLRRQPRKNPIFDLHDGMLHLSYVGACIPGMYPAVRGLFEAVRLGLTTNPDLFGRVRLHFVGTNYLGETKGPEGVMAIARAAGLEEQVTEHPARVSYLDSLQIMLDSRALVLVGSDETHYTASKVFPYLLSEKPLLAVFHEHSSVNEILKGCPAAWFIGFSSGRPVDEKAELILQSLQEALLMDAKNYRDERLAAADGYSTRTMAARLAESFDRVIARSKWVSSPATARDSVILPR